jgi:hypothetical protein
MLKKENLAVKSKEQTKVIESCKKKYQIMYKGKNIRSTSYFSAETLKARNALNVNSCQIKILYVDKIFF